MNQVSGDILSLPSESVYSDEGAVLIVEDCEPLLFYLNSAVLALGFKKQFLAATLAEAEAAWTQHKGEISHILLNYELSDGLGLDFGARVLAEQPALKIVVTTGYDLASVRESTAGASRFHFLQKPFRLSELNEALQTAPAGTITSI